MKCPFCGYMDDKVLESRGVQDGGEIRRRRECLACARRFTTYERIEDQSVMVVKRDGRREPFDRNKVLHGMIAACEKRPIGMDVLELSAEQIERMVHDAGKREMESNLIGEMVMEALKGLDHVAYVRFASVYRQFEDVGQFKEIVDVLGGD